MASVHDNDDACVTRVQASCPNCTLVSQANIDGHSPDCGSLSASLNAKRPVEVSHSFAGDYSCACVFYANPKAGRRVQSTFAVYRAQSPSVRCRCGDVEIEIT